MGSVYQLILDWSGTFVSPCTDCANLSGGGAYRVIRGGTFSDGSFYYIESSTRSAGSPTGRYDFMGFRCARIP